MFFVKSRMKFPPEAENQVEKTANDDFKSRCMEKMRLVPGLGLVLALLSGICFATAGFTVELMEGTGDEGHGVDASIIIVYRSVSSTFA